MVKLTVVEQQLADLDPNDAAEELLIFTIQCHLVGFVVGAILSAAITTAICWYIFSPAV